MTDKKRVFVLVGDEQTPLSPSDVAGAVVDVGFAQAARRYGFSESTLRKFLKTNGIRSRRTVVYEWPGSPGHSPIVIAPRDPLVPLSPTADAEVPLGG